MALLVLVLTAPTTSADVLTPESASGSPNAERIDSLYKITLAVGVVIFVLVEGLLIYTLVRYRHRRRDPEPPAIRGNTRLEIGWTVGAALILVVLAVITFAYLPGIKDPERSGPEGLQASEASLLFATTDQPEPPGGRLEIVVNSQQYLFRYDYPSAQRLFSYYEMVVPIDTTVTLKVTSSDVIHAWWIPKLGGKVDAVPGKYSETWFKIPQPGIYYGQCAELCGENHAQMRTRVRAVPVAEFKAWAARQTEDIKRSQRQLAASRAQREN